MTLIRYFQPKDRSVYDEVSSKFDDEWNEISGVDTEGGTDGSSGK